MKNEKFKVLEVEIKNFKNISDLKFSPGGNNVFLVGKNAVGKTSVIQAVWSALSQKAQPTMPLKSGEEKGNVLVVLGNDEKRYTIERRYVGDNTYLEITSPDGFSTTRVSALENLVGNIDFDVFQFVDLARSVPGRRQQVDIVKQMIDPSILQDIDSLKSEIAEEKENKSFWTIKKRDLEGRFKEAELTLRGEKPVPVDVKELRSKYEEGQEHNSRHEQLIWKQTDLTEQQRKLEAQLKEVKEKQMAISNKLTTIPLIDITEIGNQIRQADQITAEVETWEAAENIKSQYTEARENIKKQDINVADLESNIQTLIASAKLPVKGLTFNEDGLLYNGLPFDDTALATSELLGIGLELAMAQNPQAGVLKIARGESIGKELMDSILATVKKRGYQVFIEQVSDEAQELKVIIKEA